MTLVSPAVAAKRARYRSDLLDAAEHLFAEHGVEGTRIDQIAARAGLAPRTLYTVFDSKQALVDEVSERHRAALVRVASEAINGAPYAWGALLGVVRDSTAYYLDHLDHLRYELREARSWADERASESSTWTAAFAGYARLFDRAMNEGHAHPGDPAALARALLALQQSQLAHWVASDRELDHEAVIASVTSLVERAFGSAPDRPPSVRSAPTKES